MGGQQEPDLPLERLDEIARDVFADMLLNGGAPIAVVGSGLSAPYGGPTWSDLAKYALQEALRQLKTISDDPKLAVGSKAVVEQAKRAVIAFNSETGVAASDIYMALQVASDGIDLAQRNNPGSSAPGLAFKPFMARLVSDPGYRLWWELRALIKPDRDQERQDLDALAEKVAAQHGADGWLRLAGALYSWPMLEALCGRCGSDREPSLRRLLSKLKRSLVSGGHSGTVLPPDLRGLLPFVLGCAAAAGNAVKGAELIACAHTLISEEPVRLRPVTDPIRRLYDRLGIRRFITLNYDHEIENALMIDDLQAIHGSGYGLMRALRDGKADREYQSVAGQPRYTGGITRRYSDGMAASSDIYQPVASARLIEFALNSPDYRLQILHQHGRADYEDKPDLDILDQMVLTDADLNRLYRRNPRDATTLEQALDVTLTGNPILFVGIGLGEPEITRALRQLVAQQRASIDDPAFAIMAFVDKSAADKPSAGLAPWRRQIGLLRQYGIHMLDAGHPRHGRPGLSAKVTALEALKDWLALPRSSARPDAAALEKKLDACHEAKIAADPYEGPIFEWFAKQAADKHFVSAKNAGLFSAWLKLLISNQMSQALVSEIDRLHDGAGDRFRRTQWKQPDPDDKKADHGLDTYPREHATLRHQDQTSRHVAKVDCPDVAALHEVVGQLRVRVKRTGVTLLEGADFTGKGTVLRELTRALPSRPWCHLNLSMSLEVDSAVIQLLRTVLSRDVKPDETRNRLNNLLAALAAPPKPTPAPLIILSGLERLLDARSQPLAPELELMVRMLVDPRLGARKLHVLIAGTAPAIRWVRSLAEEQGPDSVRMPQQPAGLLLKLEEHVERRAASTALPERARQWRHRSAEPYVANGARAPASQYLIGLVLEHWHEIAGPVSRAQAELDRVILQNLAYIGQPVEIQVLAYMPDVAAAAAAAAAATETPENAIRVACDRLTTAGLAVAIQRSQGEDAVVRIALPRAVLAELRERFGVRSGEEQLSNSFTLTLAASMPHDLVIPDEDVSEALGKAVGHLRAAWKDVELDTNAKGWVDRLRGACERALPDLGDAKLAELRAQTAGTVGRINRIERLARMSHTPAQANLRAAAAIVRGFFNAATLVSIDPGTARWRSAPGESAGDYEAHRKRIEKLLSRTRLINRLKTEVRDELGEVEKELRHLGQTSMMPRVDELIREKSASMQPPAAADDNPSDPGALYSGELVWLLNEAGVIAQLQGRLKVAARHYRNALDALDRFKGRGAGMSWRRLIINQAFLKIERGRIAEARADLMALKDASGMPELRLGETLFVAENEASICRPLIAGYLGLADALEGHFETARDLYKEAIEGAQCSRQQRALALFYWRRGALELHLGDQNAAHRDLDLAIAEAENGQQLDVVWRARLKRTELAEGTSPAMAQTIFREARDYATAMKLHRLEAMALHREAEWRMEREDLTVAAALATQAMCSATANGMTLMRIRLRTLMGEIMLRQGDASGEFLLHRAISHANRIGYQLQLNQARKALLRVQTMRRG